MNKMLLILLALVIIGGGLFYFLYLAPPPQEISEIAPPPKIETTFNLKVLEKLDNFLIHGSFPISIEPSSLRKSDPAKANDPFFN